MIKTCPICEKHFETHDKRKKYCSIQCARRAKINNNSERNKDYREEKRWDWAYSEAEKIQRIRGIDELAGHVYNSYSKKKGSNYAQEGLPSMWGRV